MSVLVQRFLALVRQATYLDASPSQATWTPTLILYRTANNCIRKQYSSEKDDSDAQA